MQIGTAFPKTIILRLFSKAKGMGNRTTRGIFLFVSHRLSHRRCFQRSLFSDHSQICGRWCFIGNNLFTSFFAVDFLNSSQLFSALGKNATQCFGIMTDTTIVSLLNCFERSWRAKFFVEKNFCVLRRKTCQIITFFAYAISKIIGANHDFSEVCASFDYCWPIIWSRLPDSDRGPHPYHGCALPTELSRLQKNGGSGWIWTTVGSRRQIYSLMPLTTRPHYHVFGYQGALM